jgi:hypothetical protein
VTVNNGGTYEVGSVQTVQALTVDSGGAVDVTNQGLIIQTGTLSTIITRILDGRTSNTDGITSTSVVGLTGPNTTDRMALGYRQQVGGDLVASGPFAGQLLNGGEILVAYVVAGDSNLDGNVNLNDFDAWFANVGPLASKRWDLGDFNGDGNVNLNDFDIWFSHVGLSPLPGESLPAADIAAMQAYALDVMSGGAVPEPASLGLAALAATAGLMRRSRRNKVARL